MVPQLQALVYYVSGIEIVQNFWLLKFMIPHLTTSPWYNTGGISQLSSRIL